MTQSQALYRKWRPHHWEQVVGQEHVVQTLRNAITAGRVAHAYLFAGPRGTGKTTTARLLAKAINCLDSDLTHRPCDQCENCQAVNRGRFLDLIEIDAASNTSVEDVRSLRDKINFSPNQGQYKVYIIDEVHMLSTAAFNALLKTLEEPPPHAIFILATTEVHKIPATVLSRCQRHEFRRIAVVEIVRHLKEMAQGEQFQIEEEALVLVARQSTGCLRDAISLLDQLASTGGEITLEMTHQVLGTAASQAVLDIIEAVITQDTKNGLEHIQHALDAGSDPRQFARQIVDYLREVLLIRMGSGGQVDAASETRAAMARHSQAFTPAELLRLIRVFNGAASEARLAWQPALPLELAFVEAVEKPAAPEAENAARPAGSRSQSAAPPQAHRPAAAYPAPQAAEPAEPNPVPGIEAGTEGGLTLEKLNQNWRTILAEARQHNPTTQALLNSSKPLGFKGGVLFLAFSSDFIKAKMEKPEHMEVAQAVLAQVLGVEVPIRCVVAANKRSSPPPEVDSDGMVATAMRDLGGEIVDIQ